MALSEAMKTFAPFAIPVILSIFWTYYRGKLDSHRNSVNTRYEPLRERVMAQDIVPKAKDFVTYVTDFKRLNPSLNFNDILSSSSEGITRHLNDLQTAITLDDNIKETWSRMENFCKKTKDFLLYLVIDLAVGFIVILFFSEEMALLEYQFLTTIFYLVFAISSVVLSILIVYFAKQFSNAENKFSAFEKDLADEMRR
jgi:hypothetical protein